LVFGYPDSALVYQCRECKHIFVAGELTPEQLTDMYTNYYPRSNFNVDDYTPHKEKSGFLYWLDGEEGHAYRHVPKNVRVLDIGCGYCETLGYHKARGCEVYGVEADENARKIAERYGFNIEIGLFDPKKYEPESFDYVTMSCVLEHIIDPLKVLQGIICHSQAGRQTDCVRTESFCVRTLFFRSPLGIMALAVSSALVFPACR
jgi:SAM-dependent methyltransferase